jgi:hypothetical protein
MKCMILPRQARDKHRENTQKRVAFSPKQLFKAVFPMHTDQVKKRHFLSHLYIKVIILPRHAPDKHRENSKKSAVFVQKKLDDLLDFFGVQRNNL